LILTNQIQKTAILYPRYYLAKLEICFVDVVEAPGLFLPRSRFNYEESNANNYVTIPSTLLKKIVNMLSKNGGGAGFVVYKK
jgi:hypothetical protein